MVKNALNRDSTIINSLTGGSLVAWLSGTLSGLTINEVWALTSILMGVITLAVTFIFQARRDRREKEKEKVRITYLNMKIQYYQKQLGKQEERPQWNGV